MGLLSKLARSSARATGRALSAHVVPDSLIPSWKTQKRVASGYSLLKKAAKKRKPAPTGKGSGAGKAAFARPAPVAPKKKFDKNSWATGRNMPSGAGFGERSPSPGKSSSRSSLSKRASVLRQQSSDLLRNPRVVAQMGLDLLEVEYQAKKKSFLSEVKQVSQNYKAKKSALTSRFRK